jgi:Tfp pilus assembly pilus retraction ATPase PilT
MKKDLNCNNDMLEIFKNALEIEPEIITIGEMSKESLFLLQKMSEKKGHVIITTMHVSDESRCYSKIFSLLSLQKNLSESDL